MLSALSVTTRPEGPQGASPNEPGADLRATFVDVEKEGPYIGKGMFVNILTVTTVRFIDSAQVRLRSPLATLLRTFQGGDFQTMKLKKIDNKLPRRS